MRREFLHPRELFTVPIGAVLRSMRTVAYLLLDSLCQLRRVKPGNTAIIVRLDAIGDFFMWLQSGAVEIAKHARGEGRHSVILANSAMRSNSGCGTRSSKWIPNG